MSLTTFECRVDIEAKAQTNFVILENRFSASSIELKHLCLEYITPWLPNLVSKTYIRNLWNER